jgi:hypothetical protein
MLPFFSLIRFLVIKRLSIAILAPGQRVVKILKKEGLAEAFLKFNGRRLRRGLI